jgi:putative ABC transport system substrate-binding protein
LQRETHVIPIVFVGVVDPIGPGLVASLARPGGNFTGTLLNEESIVRKWLAMLKELAPNTERVAVLSSREFGLFDVPTDGRSRGPLARNPACGQSIHGRCRN